MKIEKTVHEEISYSIELSREVLIQMVNDEITRTMEAYVGDSGETVTVPDYAEITAEDTDVDAVKISWHTRSER